MYHIEHREHSDFLNELSQSSAIEIGIADQSTGDLLFSSKGSIAGCHITFKNRRQKCHRKASSI